MKNFFETEHSNSRSIKVWAEKLNSLYFCLFKRPAWFNASKILFKKEKILVIYKSNKFISIHFQLTSVVILLSQEKTHVNFSLHQNSLFLFFQPLEFRFPPFFMFLASKTKFLFNRELEPFKTVVFLIWLISNFIFRINCTFPRKKGGFSSIIQINLRLQFYIKLRYRHEQQSTP